MIFALLFLAVCKNVEMAERGSEELVAPGFITEFKGKFSGSHIYITTIDGFLTCINIFSGDIEWKVYTGSPLFQSTDMEPTKFIPSIDGFLYTFNEEYGYKRMLLPFDKLAYLAPFKTECGKLFLGKKADDCYFINGETGELYRNFSSESTESENYEHENMMNFVQVIKQTYTLRCFHNKAESITSTDFSIFTSESLDIPYDDILIKTFQNGGISISLNGSIVSQTRIPLMPINIYSPHGKFKFQITLNGEKIHKSKVLFLNFSYGPIAFPVRPSKIPKDEEFLIYGLPAIGGMGTSNHKTFQYGVIDVWKPYSLIWPKDSNTTSLIGHPFITKVSLFPYKMCSLGFLVSYATIMLIQGLITWGSSSHVNIVPDSEDSTKGTFGETSVTIVSIMESKFLPKSLNLAQQSPNLRHTPKFYGTQHKRGMVMIAYQPMEKFNDMNVDIKLLAKTLLESLKSIHESKVCHTQITEDVIYSSTTEEKSILLAGLEWCCTEYNEEKGQKDIYDLGILLRNIAQKKAQNEGKDVDPLLSLLLNDMMSENPEDRPKPDEALEYPFFFTSEEKIKVYTQLNAELWHSGYPKKNIVQFEAYKINIMQAQSWDVRVPELIRQDIHRSEYSFSTLKDLIRLIRNKHEHKNESKIFDSMNNDEFFKYFDDRFPNLFTYCYYFSISHPYVIKDNNAQENTHEDNVPKGYQE